MTRAATIDPSLGPPPFWHARQRWSHLAQEAGRVLATRTATLDDYRMWNRSGERYGFAPGTPLALDSRARWWARWLPFV